MIVNGKWVDGWKTPHRRVNPKGRGSSIYRKESLFKAYPLSKTIPAASVVYSGQLVYPITEDGQTVWQLAKLVAPFTDVKQASKVPEVHMVLGEQSNDPDVVASGKLGAGACSLNFEVDIPEEFFASEVANTLAIGDWVSFDANGKYIKYVLGTSAPVVGRVTEAYRAIGVGIECTMNNPIAKPQQNSADRIVSAAGSSDTPAIETNSDTKGVVTIASWWYPNGINSAVITA